MLNSKSQAGTEAQQRTEAEVTTSSSHNAKPNVVRCFSSHVEIIGVGYGKDVNIGESYLQETVVNMWSFAPDGAFTYYSANGSQMVLQEYTKTAKDTYSTRTLSKEEITTDIKNALVAKGQRVLK